MKKTGILSLMFLLFVSTVCYAANSANDATGVVVLLVLFVPIALIIAYIVGSYKFHKFCMANFGVSAFRLGSLFALTCANIFLICAAGLAYLMNAGRDGSGGINTPTLIFGLIVWGLITVINLKKNINLMGTKYGIIGTALASGGSILIFVVFFFYRSIGAGDLFRKA